MTTTFLPYGKQSISEDDVKAVSEALKGDFITRGPKIEEFESAFAGYCGSSFAVFFPNGTIALEAACHAARLSPHDRLITSPNTFVASALPAFKVGATPVFLDIDRATGNIDLEHFQVNAAIQSTRGKNVIIPVHFAGIAVDMKQLDRLISDPEAVVIEDAAHAIGSHYPSGEKVGSCAYSDMTCFSFHPVKTMTTGEGGMVTTNSQAHYDKLKLYRNNGLVNHDVTEITGNYNVTEFQAALGLSQLSRLDTFVEKRCALVARYREKLPDSVQTFQDEQDEYTAFHLMVVQVEERDQLREKLQESGIGTQVHYKPIYRHSFFKKNIAEYYPEMEAYWESALSLPLFPEMEEADVDRVCLTISKK